MKEIGDLSPFSDSACTLNTYKEGGKKKKKSRLCNFTKRFL